MSEIPRDELSYRNVVAEYFLGLRGAGLMLSPLDAEQVAEWEQRGIPVPVVCRGLRRGFDEHVASHPVAVQQPGLHVWYDASMVTDRLVGAVEKLLVGSIG